MISDEFQQTFALLINEARGLPDLLMTEASEGLSEHVAGDDFPTSTVMRMQLMANVEFEGAVALLMDEITTVSSEIILRGLLEACAHLHFIAAGHDQNERKCRAIRTELGMAAAIESLALQFRGIDTDERDRLLAEAHDRQTFLQAEQSRLGCRGRRRDYGDVGATLKEMVAQDQRLDWALDMYVTATSLAHQQMPDRIIRDVGGGMNSVVLPANSIRAARFDHILVTYGLLSQRFYQVVKTGLGPDRFLNALQSLRNHELIQRAMQGAYD